MIRTDLRKHMKLLLQKIIKSCGYDLFKHDARYNEVFSRCALLDRFGDPVVLDVGANRGQFGMELREYGFRGKIISFEPLSAAHAALTAVSESDAKWVVAQRAAIGDEPGEGEINVSGNSVSSSMLPLEQIHLDIAPCSAYVGKENVDVMRLDDAVRPHTSEADEFYLKADTQGFEKHVLDGAPDVLARSRAVELELSVTPTYGGCLLFDEGLDYMKSKGFRLYSSYQVLQDRKTGELLQANVFFVRA